MAKAREMEEKMTKNLNLESDKEMAAATTSNDQEEAGPPKKEKDFVIGHLSNVYLANNKSEAWKGLTDDEKNYAYYLSEAGQAGAKMIYH